MGGTGSPYSSGADSPAHICICMLKATDRTQPASRNREPCACQPSCAQEPHAQHTALTLPGVLCLVYAEATLAGAAGLATDCAQSSECLDRCLSVGALRCAKQP